MCVIDRALGNQKLGNWQSAIASDANDAQAVLMYRGGTVRARTPFSSDLYSVLVEHKYAPSQIVRPRG
jgi:hypothetical protein